MSTTHTSEQLAAARPFRAPSSAYGRRSCELIVTRSCGCLTAAFSPVPAPRRSRPGARIRRVRRRQGLPATKSGTGALHCAAAAVGVQPEDKVIVPAYTFRCQRDGDGPPGPLRSSSRMWIRGRTTSIPTGSQSAITDRTTAVVAVAIHGQPASRQSELPCTPARALGPVQRARKPTGSAHRAVVRDPRTHTALPGGRSSMPWRCTR